MENLIYFEDIKLKYIAKRLHLLSGKYTKYIEHLMLHGDVLDLYSNPFARAMKEAQRSFLTRNMSNALKYVKIAESIK